MNCGQAAPYPHHTGVNTPPTWSLYASTEAAVYLLNAKRADLAEIEHRYGVMVQVVPEGENEGAKMRVASSGPRPTEMPRFEPIIDPVEDRKSVV